MLKYLDRLQTENGLFETNQRVWVVDRWGVRAGTIIMIDQWTCRKGQPDEHVVPFIKIKYDETFNPIPGIQGREEDYFWREKELASVFNQDFISNCCEQKIITPDHFGHGKCARCGDNCTPITPDVQL